MYFALPASHCSSDPGRNQLQWTLRYHRPRFASDHRQEETLTFASQQQQQQQQASASEFTHTPAPSQADAQRSPQPAQAETRPYRSNSERLRDEVADDSSRMQASPGPLFAGSPHLRSAEVLEIASRHSYTPLKPQKSEKRSDNALSDLPAGAPVPIGASLGIDVYMYVFIYGIQRWKHGLMRRSQQLPPGLHLLRHDSAPLQDCCFRHASCGWLFTGKWPFSLSPSPGQKGVYGARPERHPRRAALGLKHTAVCRHAHSHRSVAIV